MIQLPYVALCCPGGEKLEIVALIAWNEPRQKNCIVLHIAQNEPYKQLYVREWNSVIREALCTALRTKTIGHPAGFDALEPLVVHCVQEKKVLMHALWLPK